jgi:hypothetical protein
MADIEISGPDGSSFSFPEGTSSDTIKSAMQKHYGAPKEKTVETPVFDPATGAATGFTEQGPAGPSKKAVEFERRAGPFGYAKEFGKGLAGSVAGMPAELTVNLPSTIESLGRTGLRAAGADVSEKTAIPRVGYGAPEATDFLFGRAKPGSIESGMRTAGEVAGGLLGPGEVVGLARGVSKIPSVLSRGKEAVESTMPARAIEKSVGKATTPSEVGKDIDQTIGERLRQYVDTRRTQFEAVKDAYINAGRQKEATILNDYKNELNAFYAKNADRLSNDEIALLEKLSKRLEPRPVELGSKEAGTVLPGFDTIEKERRFLSDVASGLKVEGAEAINAMFAKDMSKLLEDVISKNVPKEFKTFNDTYKTLSEPINLYNSRLGQSVVARADEYLPQVAKLDPAKVPAKFFETQRSVQELKALTADPQLAEQFARRHLSNELEGIKTADQLKKFARDNRDWLQEFPALQAEVDRLANSVRSGEKVKNLGKILGGAALGAAGLSSLKSLSPF